MKKQLITLIAMLLPLMASADALEIDGIYYNLVSKAKSAEVTSNPNNYTGEVVIPESVTYEGTEYSVTSIGDHAFSWCGGLTSITIPNSITSIGKNAFYWCSLTSIIIPNSVTSIGDRAFYGISGLTSVTIGDGVTTIGDCAFQGCCDLTSVTIPNSVIRIGSGAFQECSGLTSITIPNSVTSVNPYTFKNCSGLISITIPNTVTIIDGSAFAGCSGLTSITIPNSVTSIVGEAFSGCSNLTSVTIGSGVKYINGSAFAKCPELKDVYCYAEKVPSTNTNAFDGSYIEYVTLHVPDASVANYKATAPWSSFGSIVGLNGESLPKCATPTINYDNGKVSFSCETEGVEFVSELTNADASKYYSNEINVSGKYLVKVYATKEGYQDSDTATKEFQLSASSSVEPGGTTEEGKKGDLNGDNVVNAADMVTLVNIIMGEGSGGDNPPVSGDESEVTSMISAYYAGGAINKINNTIQSGSQLLWGFKNGSSVSVTIIGAVLINGVTGTESDNLLPEPLQVAAGETKGLTTTIGVLGIQEPKIRFTYKYNQKEYSVEADYKDLY